MASSRARRLRASTGTRPPVEKATITGERSTTAGRMNVQSSGRSATLTGTPRAAGLAVNRRVDLGHAGGHDHQRSAREVPVGEGHGVAAAAMAAGQFHERWLYGRRHHARQRAGLHQQLGLAQRHLAAADDEASRPRTSRKTGR
jgi:hypothetical protein